MRRITSTLMKVAAAAAMLTSAAGCCEDEHYIIVPDPKPTDPLLLGTISTNGQVPLPGATIKIDGPKHYTVANGSDGRYQVNVGTGSYQIFAAKGTDTSRVCPIEMVQNKVRIWNGMIVTPITVTEPVLFDRDNHIEIPYPSIYQSSGEGSGIIAFDIPAGALDKNDVLIVTFHYHCDFDVEETKAGSTASGMARLLDVEFHLQSGSTPAKPIGITADVPGEPVRTLLNDRTYDHTFIPSRGVSFETVDTGRLVMDYWLDITELDGQYWRIAMPCNEYENFYGEEPMHVLNPEFTISLGGGMSGDHVLIKCFAAAYTGLVPTYSVTTGYPLDVTLPVGTKLKIIGYQTINTYQFRVSDQASKAGNVVMKADVWDHVGPYFDVDIYNIFHIGGGSL